MKALRGCVTSAGDKLSPTIRRGVTATLLSMLRYQGPIHLSETATYVCSHADDSSRAAAAGCLGCLVQWLPAEEQVLIELLLLLFWFFLFKIIC